MNLEQFKTHLKEVNELTFFKPNGKEIPKHFHITEVGQIDKKFIDCGGTIRHNSSITLQLWENIDIWHRLEPHKLLTIIEMSETKLGVKNYEIEIEYQGDTIEKYGVDFRNGEFIFTTKQTDCLAIENCVLPTEKIKVAINSAKEVVQSCCSPNSKCC